MCGAAGYGGHVTHITDITTQELKGAYQRGKLWMLGIAFHEALHMPVVYRAMVIDAQAHRKANGAPRQAELLLGLSDVEISAVKQEDRRSFDVRRRAFMRAREAA